MIMDVNERIEEVIAEYVRPYLKGHGGDIEVISFNDGILKFKLTGMCSNCPSSLLTTEEVVAKELVERVEEVKAVRLEAGVSDDLISFAKSLMSHK